MARDLPSSPHNGEVATPNGSLWIDDRHPVFRRGLVSIVKSAGYSVVGESAGLSPEPDTERCDVLIFNPEGGALREAKQLAEEIHLVALLRNPSKELVFDLVDSGISGILPHDELTSRTLVGCLRSVVNGHISLPHDLIPTLLNEAERASKGERAGLTPREMDVLRLMAEGDDTKTIASTLSYSERTVKNVVHDLLVKMNCRNRVHAVALATRQGLI